MIGMSYEELKEKLINYSALNPKLIPDAVAKVISENNEKIEKEIENIAVEAVMDQIRRESRRR